MRDRNVGILMVIGFYMAAMWTFSGYSGGRLLWGWALVVYVAIVIVGAVAHHQIKKSRGRQEK